MSKTKKSRMNLQNTILIFAVLVSLSVSLMTSLANL